MASLNRRRVHGGFITGVVGTQFVNSALHLAQPILMAELTDSLGYAALFSSFDTAVHMGGTYLGGWPVDRFGARRVLIWATFLRGAALAAIPVAMIFGGLSAFGVALAYTADALVRGFVDSAVYTLPLELAEHEAEELDRVNTRYEIAFDVGGILGPLALGGMMAFLPGVWAHAAIPAGFALSALAFRWVPATSRRRPALKAGESGSWAGAKAIFRDRGLLFACAGYMTFNLYPLRKLLSAFFAKSVLKHKASAGPLGSAFALGGLLGSFAYARWREPGDRGRWILAGSVGTLVLALGWAPSSLPWMMAAAFLFAATNSGARLSLTRMRQELTPIELSGGVTAASRFGANLVSVGAKSAVGAAFLAGATPAAAFSFVSALLGALSLAQLALARRFVTRASPSEGLLIKS